MVLLVSVKITSESLGHRFTFTGNPIQYGRQSHLAFENTKYDILLSVLQTMYKIFVVVVAGNHSQHVLQVLIIVQYQ